MNAIRIRKRVDDQMLRSLPELRELSGREVEIIVLDETPAAADTTAEAGELPEATPYDNFFAHAGRIDLDWDAYRRQRALDLEP